MSGDVLKAAIDALKKRVSTVAAETNRTSPSSPPEKKEPFAFGYACGRHFGLLEAESILTKILDGEDEDDID